VDADPEFDHDILRHVDVVHGHATLDFNGTAHRVDGAREFHQQAVASCFDNAAPMDSYGGVNEGLSDGLEPSQGTFLIDRHKTAIARDIRRQHRCQSPFYAFVGQRNTPGFGSSRRASKHIGALLD
jgi:hypothetical protein